jgi:hypothetical protein
MTLMLVEWFNLWWREHFLSIYRLPPNISRSAPGYAPPPNNVECVISEYIDCYNNDPCFTTKLLILLNKCVTEEKPQFHKFVFASSFSR